LLRRVLLWTGAVLVVGFLVIQLVPYGRDHTNPAVVSEPAWDSAATRAYAVTACFDCHSNETAWPWYTNIAPISWLVQHDVEEGRQAVNFSEWGRGGEGDDAAETVSENRMPPFVYVILHPDANLADADRQAFIQGLRATFGGEGGGGGEAGD
jgi:Haem-binding domain